MKIVRWQMTKKGSHKLGSEEDRRIQLLVIGSAEDHCTEEARRLSYQIGAEAAKHDAILLTGGLGGVMEEASKGAKENHGITVGIIPHDEVRHANRYCDIVIATGMGWARDFITAYSADAVIVVAGGTGALIEASAAYLKAKPIVAVEGSGGTADQVKGAYLDERKCVRILSERDPSKAVEKALELARKNIVR